MILQALDNYYHRMPGIEKPGWSREKFGWCVWITAEGEPIDVTDLRDASGKKPVVQSYEVPAGVKRTVGIAPNFLWDKTAYVFGRTAGEGRRAAQEHAAFVTLHLNRLAGAEDAGLVALRRFLERWTPDRFDDAPFTPEMLDANILFRLEGDGDYLHRRPAAQALVAAASAIGEVAGAFCLVSGQSAPIQRLHPTIRGVEGAQSSGATLVSFNLDAFASYGKEQGDNSPTSEAAAFRYGAALNRMLVRGSANRVARPIGDATTVFWADASDAAAAGEADRLFGAWFDPPVTDAEEAQKLAEQLAPIAAGKPLAEINPRLEEGTRFHILGLSPNAARLSVRYWLTGDFVDFAKNLAAHHADCRIEPSPWRRAPSVNYLLAKTTVRQSRSKTVKRPDTSTSPALEKVHPASVSFEGIPPQLAGELMRAVLLGTPYPRSWLAAAIVRLRAGDDPGDGWHAAAMRAVLVRNRRLRRKKSDIPGQGETPMALDRTYCNTGYVLGRLFAMYEAAQIAALGYEVKATMRDKYFGGASAAPASIFPLVISGGQNNLAKARKTKKTAGWAFLIERELEQIMGLLAPDESKPMLPRSLKLDDQAEFAIGYYHQRHAKLRNEKGEEVGATTAEPIEGDSDND